MVCDLKYYMLCHIPEDSIYNLRAVMTLFFKQPTVVSCEKSTKVENVLSMHVWQHVVEQHASTSPNLFKDAILPSVLT